MPISTEAENLGFIADLSTGISLEFDSNPSEIKSKIEVHWSKHRIPGLSHQRSQYLNTDNVPFDFTLVFDGLVKGGAAGIVQKKAMLKSFCYPRASRRIDGAGPGKLLLVLPNAYRVKGYIESVEFEDVMFYSDGKVRRFNANIKFFEEPEKRITSDVVRKDLVISKKSIRYDFAPNRNQA